MNISFLPEKIKRYLADAVADRVPVSVVRSSASVDGTPGEGYVISYNDRLFLFSRKLGENDYCVSSELFGKVGTLELRKDGINSYLDVSFGGENYSLKFSSFEEKNLQSIIDAWREDGGAVGDIVDLEVEAEPDGGSVGGTSSARKVDASTISPLEGLAAALMYVSAIDNEISSVEDHYIVVLFARHRNLLQSALAYYKRHTFEDLLTELKGLTNEQKLCYLANMLEIGMRDGVLHSSEQRIINRFTEEMGISDEEYNAVRQVLLIKNKISVLDT